MNRLIPMLPYFFIPKAIHALYWSIAVTGVVLLIFGWSVVCTCMASISELIRLH